MNLGCEVCGNQKVERGLCDKCKFEEMKHFIWYQGFTAKRMSILLREYGDTPADDVIRWLAMDGMVGNPLAVTVATHVYKRYLAQANSTADTIIADLTVYYQLLGRALVKAGVRI